MFCKNCGAAVTGKYCSCCGTRIRSYGKEFFLALRRRKRAFANSKYHLNNDDLNAIHSANFCWERVQNKIVEPLRSQIIASAWFDGEALLDEVEEKADSLYEQVYGLIQSL